MLTLEGPQAGHPRSHLDAHGRAGRRSISRRARSHPQLRRRVGRRRSTRHARRVAPRPRDQVQPGCSAALRAAAGLARREGRVHGRPAPEGGALLLGAGSPASARPARRRVDRRCRENGARRRSPRSAADRPGRCRIRCRCPQRCPAATSSAAASSLPPRTPAPHVGRGLRRCPRRTRTSSSSLRRAGTARAHPGRRSCARDRRRSPS